MGPAAHDIRARADQLRRQRAALAARCENAAWHSRSAIAFRHKSASVLARMDACAHALDQAAAALERHAHTVHQRVAELESVAATVEHGVGAMVRGVGHGLHRATHWMGV